MIKLLSGFFYRRSPQKQALDCARTCCGTLAVYAGDLEVRPEVLAALDAECSSRDARSNLKSTRDGPDIPR